MRSLRIGIIGGSLAGLFAGILLQRDGHDVVVYERSASGLGGRGAGLVGQQDLFRILRLIGCEHVSHVGVTAWERIYLDLDGDVTETVPTAQMQISWDYLYSTVVSLMEPERYRLGRVVDGVRQARSGAEIIFADGTTELVDLVIGADGLGSVVRKAVNPDGHDNHFAGYVACRGLLSEQLLPAEASLLLERFAFYVSRGAHAVGYLVPGPHGEMDKGSRRYSWIWYRKVDQADIAKVLTDRLGRAHSYSLPRGGLSTERREALLTDARETLPRQFSLAVAADSEPAIHGVFDYQAPRMTGKSIALVGDAAFVVRPHSAMGLAKAAGDVMMLREALAAENDLQEALTRFERVRSPVGREIADYGRQLGATVI